jgi:repressor LexA
MHEMQRPPTVREIGEHFQISSTNGVRAILLALERKGHLKRSPRLSRGLLPVDAPDSHGRDEASEEWLEVPLLGRAAAGAPILAEETRDGEHLRVPRSWVPKGRDCFALKVRGESMCEAGIMDGDTVVAAKAAEARDGEIIVALLGDEATIKTFYARPNMVELRPANHAFKPIHVKATSPEFRVLGKVVAVWRNYPI